MLLPAALKPFAVPFVREEKMQEGSAAAPRRSGSGRAWRSPSVQHASSLEPARGSVRAVTEIITSATVFVGSWSGLDEVIRIAGESGTSGAPKRRYSAHTGNNVSLF